VIPRRRRVTWSLGIAFAVAFAILVTPAVTADRWLASFGVGPVVKGEPAPITIRVPAFTGLDLPELHVAGGGVVIARGEIAQAGDPEIVDAILATTPRGPLPYIAFFVLALVFGTIFTHHMRRSTLGRLVRVQVVSLVSVALLAAAVKVLLLGSAVSALVVPVAVMSMVPTLVLDRVVGLATGVFAALVISLLGPFDLGVAILMLVQASTAGLVVAERPRNRWKSALLAGVVTTLFTTATYVLLGYLTSGHVPPIGDPLQSPWLAAAIGPAIATVIAVPMAPIYQLLVGEITHGKLVELEDLSHPLLKQIAERAPGTWQHSLAMANMAEIAANAIGAHGRLVRVGAYFHDLGKSLQPKYFIENLEPGETSPHDRLPPEVSCDAIFAHVTEGIVAARKAGLHERIIDFMHMHHGNGVLEYFWGKTREQGNPNHFTIEHFRYPGHPPQTRETAILAICDAVEAASRTLKKPDAASIDSLVQRIVYGKLHLGQLDESGMSMSDLRRVSDSLRETIRHANHGRIEYPWQKAQQDASASQAAVVVTNDTSQVLRLDSLDRRPVRTSGSTGAAKAVEPDPTPAHSGSAVIDLGVAERKSSDKLGSGNRLRVNEAIAETSNLERPDQDLAVVETAPQTPVQRPTPEPSSASRQGVWEPSASAPPDGGVADEPDDDDFEREVSRQIDDPVEVPPPATADHEPVDEVPAGARPAGTPQTFAGMPPPQARTQDTTGARKRAATIPPTPHRTSPTVPPPSLSAPPARPAEPPPIEPRSTGLASGPTNNQTLLGTASAATGSTTGERRRTTTVPSDPPITRLADRAANDPAAWSATPAEPLRRASEPPGVRGERPSDPPRRPSEPPKRPSEPPPSQSEPPRVVTLRPHDPPRDPQRTLQGEPPPRLPAEARPSDPMMTTLRGSSAPARLPASRDTPPKYPAEPSIHADASAPVLRPATPTATPTRLGGPPAPVELDSAITNPPPMRRGGSAPPPQRDISPAQRLPGILLEREALEHDAQIGRGPDSIDDDIRVTAPRVPVVPAADDAGRTEPSMPRVELPLRAPPTDPPSLATQREAHDGSWAAGLASRIDASIDDWSLETPVVPPTKAELRSLLGAPDPTRQQSLEELERLHAAARDLPSDPEILPPRQTSMTHEVQPEDIEASIEIAPRARTRSPSAIGVAKPKKPE